MRGWVPSGSAMAAILVAAALAGCVDEGPGAPFTSDDAIARAADVVAEHPGAVLTSVLATHGDDERLRGWYWQQGFATDVPAGDLLTGRAHRWVLVYYLPPEAGHLPDALTVEVTHGGVEVRESAGRPIGAGPDPMHRHADADVCLTRDTSTRRFAQLAMLEDLADSAVVATAYAQDPVMQTFLATATSWSIRATGAKSSYGNIDEWGWCWEVDGTWEIELQRDDGAKWIGVYTPDGKLLYDLDWTDGNWGHHAAKVEETFPDDPLQYGVPQSRTYPVEVGQEAQLLVLYNTTHTPRGATDVRMWLTAPDGEEHAFAHGYEIRIPGPDAGTWTLTYAYTPGPTLLGALPVPAEHHVDVSVWYRGYPPG